MQKIFTLSFTLFLLIVTTNISAQDFYILKNGQPIIKVFTNVHHTSSEVGNFTGFELKRSYLGYKINYNNYFSAKVVFDVAPPSDDNTLDYHAFLKEASLNYKSEKLNVNMGVIQMLQFYLIQKVWGHRYIMATIQDKNKFGPSNDLGISGSYKFTRWIEADLSISNGEGYKRIQTDQQLKFASGITLKPIENVIFRLYGDISTHADTAQATASLFLAYHKKGKYTIGIESNTQLNNKYVENHQKLGTSVFANYQITSNVGVFGRYDILTSNIEKNQEHPWNEHDDGELYLVGVEYSPLKNVKFALNGRINIHSEETLGTDKSIYLNVLFKL